jgi:hypothetical protein
MQLHTYVLDTKAFPANHTSANITILIKATTAKWGIETKIEAIVTDNAAHMVKAVADTGYTHIRCAAHTLNLCVTDVLRGPEIETMFENCRTTVGHFKRSSLATSK